MASQIFNTRATVRGYKVKAVNVYLGKNCEERKKILIFGIKLNWQGCKITNQLVL
jgi:hypothetical protein